MTTLPSLSVVSLIDTNETVTTSSLPAPSPTASHTLFTVVKPQRAGLGKQKQKLVSLLVIPRHERTKRKRKELSRGEDLGSQDKRSMKC